MEIRRRWWRERTLAPREGDVPQGPPVEYSSIEQGLGGDPEAALAEGLPYQTLISSLLHKHASGRLKEVLGPEIRSALIPL
jgi:hypothetical protein